MHKKWFLYLLFLFTCMTYAVAHAATIEGEPHTYLYKLILTKNQIIQPYPKEDLSVPTDSFAMTALFRWISPFNPLPLKMERLTLFHRTHIPTKNGKI